MKRQHLDQSAATLRALTYRITTSQPKQLPHIAPQVAAGLRNCRTLLSHKTDDLKSHTDASQAVNRFRTAVTALLQARTIEERWTAVVLAKGAIEAGGFEVVAKATGWVKNLLAILKRNDPPTTRLLAVVTLTRIFMLTWEDAALIREIATPNLPGLLQASITAVEKPNVHSRLLEVVLEAFATLLPRHPTIFRSYETQIRTFLLRILSSTPSNSVEDVAYSEAHHDCARRLLTALHFCAPKTGGPDKWQETIKGTISAAHSTCDRIFRSIRESGASTTSRSTVSRVAGEELGSNTADPAGLSSWQGMYAGAERLVALVRLMAAHIKCVSSNAVSVPIGSFMELATRVMAMNEGLRQQSSVFNAQVSKDEREMLFTVMPELHVATTDLLAAITSCFGNAAVAVRTHALDMLFDVFRVEHSDTGIRTASYRLLCEVLDLTGPGLPKDAVLDLTPIVRHCCDDLLSRNEKRDYSTSTATNGASAVVALDGSSRSSPEALHTAAFDLLPKLYSQLNQSFINKKTRARMDQVAILTRHKDALVASVLNPRVHGSGAQLASLLPLLAREFPECPEMEALLRPRMPTLGSNKRDMPADEDNEESEEENDQEDDVMDHENGIAEQRSFGHGAVAASSDTVTTRDVMNGQASVPGQGIDTRDEVPFSTAPEQLPAVSESPGMSTIRKRAASIEVIQDENAAKRARASPEHSAWTTATAADLTMSVVVDDKDVVPTGSLVQQRADTTAINDVDSDVSSDFEIPDLPMEDSSDEEESEEAEDA